MKLTYADIPLVFNMGDARDLALALANLMERIRQDPTRDARYFDEWSKASIALRNASVR